MVEGIHTYLQLLDNSQEDDDDDGDNEDDDEDDGSEEDEDEVEPKLKYERIGNAMNTILNGEECASCMAVHTKVARFIIISLWGGGLDCSWLCYI